MGVEVHEPNPLARALVSGDRSDPHRAVTTEDERCLVRQGRLLDSACRVGDDLHDLVQILSTRSLAVRSPSPQLTITVVPHVDGVVAK
jgi:hypothetical protein